MLQTDVSIFEKEVETPPPPKEEEMEGNPSATVGTQEVLVEDSTQR